MAMAIYIIQIVYILTQVFVQLKVRIIVRKRVIYLVGTQNSQKTGIFYPLIRTRTSAYLGVRNVSFSENFG